MAKLTASYLDYNATAPLRPEVAAAMAAALAEVGNPSSVHRFGRTARKRVEDAREKVAAAVGARPEDVIFTSGGTEANNLALNGGAGRRRIVSAIEHPSVLRAAAPGERIAVDRDGRVDVAHLASLLDAAPAPALLSVMLANNETGVIQPVAEAAAIARAHGALTHCDAVQALAKIPVAMAALDVDMLSLSAHKLGGPAGIGALVLRPGVEIAPQLVGGGQERRRRAGTENVAAIVGFGVACERVADDLAGAHRLARLRDRLEVEIRAVAPEALVLGERASRLANTSCVTMPGVAAETQVMALDLDGVAVSAGAACSSGKVAPSHVLAAMGVPEATARTAIRISLGWASRDADIDHALAAWRALYRRAGLGGRKSAA